MQAMKLLCVVVSLMGVSVGANKLCHLMDKMRDVFNIVERIEDKLDDCGCGNGNGNGTVAPNNIALGKTVTMSSLYTSTQYGDGVWAYAVDGNTSKDWFNGGCASTNSEADPWLLLDLGGTFTVTALKIFNREDGGTAVSDRLGDLSIQFGSTTTPPKIATYSGAFPLEDTIQFDMPYTGRYLRISMNKTQYLTICELELYGFASITTGYCGPTCMKSTCTDCSNTGEITLDLTAGSVQGTLTNATVDPITVPTSGTAASVDCNHRARVKVTFEPETATSCTNLLKVDMTFGANRSEHLFNLGDSKTNNGYDGDDGTQSRDAEIHGVNGNVIAYDDDVCGSGEIERKTGAVGSATTEATFWLAHNYYRLKTDTLDHELCNECLFDLNNGADSTGPVNRDLYLSFNRVNNGQADRNGYGVCSVKMSWVCNVA